MARTFIAQKISDEFHYGGSACLCMSVSVFDHINFDIDGLIFQIFTIIINDLTSTLFTRIIFKQDKDIYYCKISQLFKYGCSALFNTRIKLADEFRHSCAEVLFIKAIKCGTDIGLNMSLNTSHRLCHN